MKSEMCSIDVTPEYAEIILIDSVSYQYDGNKNILTKKTFIVNNFAEWR